MAGAQPLLSTSEGILPCQHLLRTRQHVLWQDLNGGVAACRVKQKWREFSELTIYLCRIGSDGTWRLRLNLDVVSDRPLRVSE